MKLLCTLALACLAVCSAAENLIGNPGFEMNPATGLPKMWTLSKGAVGEIVEGISGKNVLQVSGTEDGKRYWWLQSLNQIVPGHFYRLTGKVKGPAGMQTAVYVECSNPWKTISSGPIVCNGEWQEISLAIEFPKLNRPPYLVLRMTAPGKALFADLALVKAKRPQENLVKNPSFSQSGRNHLPQHWIPSKGADGKRIADAAGKKYCLQLTGTDAGKTIHFMQGDIPVKAGTEYQLSVRFKGRKDTLFGAYLETNAPWQTHASPMVKCNGEWQNLNREYPLKKHGAAYPFTLDVPSRYGEYPIVVRALDRQGKKIAEITRKFRVNAPAEREVSFRKDHVMLIDGEPFFPLGVWGVDGRKTTAEKAEILADAGFNTARCAADQIDDFASAGLMVLMKVPESLPKFTDSAHFERWDRMYRKGMQKYLKHPSLIGYCNTDEPAWRGVASAPVVEAYEYIRKIDPYRPVMLNEAPRGKIADLRSYAAACDTYGVDIYPVPSPNPHSGLDDKTMTCVGRYADLCREVVRDRKPVWMTLQGFAWGMVTHKKPFVYPAHEQNRFMAYNAVAHGATGLFWWGINCNGYENWDFVRELGKTVREIRAMAPVLVSGTVRPAKLAAANPELNILHKRCNGKNWYIVLNESPKSFNADFKLDRTEKLNVFFENRGIACADGTFSDEFTPYAVHVYSDAAELPAPLKQPATRRMFGKAFSSTDDFKEASWIWFPGKNRIPKHQSYFKCEFELHEMPVKAELFATADDFFRAYINGKAVMEHYHSRDYTEVSVRNIAEFLRTGKNTLLIKAGDGGMAPCGLLYALRITGRDGKVKTLLSDASTLASENKREWVPVEVIGKYGCKPWLFRSKAKPADTESIGAFGFPF